MTMYERVMIMNYNSMTFKLLPAVILIAFDAQCALAADDKTTYQAVSDMIGLSRDEGIDKISYDERAKLVMPPSSYALPAPREALPKPTGWPEDASRDNRRTDRFARAPGAEPEKPKPGIMERIRGPVTNTSPGTDDEPGLLQKMISSKQKTLESEPDEPQRQLLIEPPEGYRHPTRPLKEVKDTSRKNGFLGKLFSGQGNDSDPVAQTAGINEAIKKPTTETSDNAQSDSSSALSSILPSFMKN